MTRELFSRSSQILGRILSEQSFSRSTTACEEKLYAPIRVWAQVKVLILAKDFEEEVVANSKIHISCLCSEQVTLIRKDFANNRNSAVLNELRKQVGCKEALWYLRRHQPFSL